MSSEKEIKVAAAAADIPVETDKAETEQAAVKSSQTEVKAETKAKKEQTKKTETEKEEAGKEDKKKDTKAAAKPAAKKAGTKKPAAKKTDKPELKPEVYVEYQGRQAQQAAVVDRVKAAFVASGHRVSSIKSLNIYIKPEEFKAYYVINDGKYTGGVDLF